MLSFKLKRISQELTQDQLAKKSGVSRTTIVLIEKKGIENIKVCVLRKLAKALGTSVAELFFSEN